MLVCENCVISYSDYIILVRPAQNARPILLQENLTELNNRQLLICSYLYTIIAM